MKKPLTAILMSIAALSVPYMAVAAPPGMSATDEMVAKMQIQELMYRYALTHNSDDPKGYASLFTEDGDFMGIKGRDAIYKMAQGEVKKMSALGVSVEGAYRFGFMRSQIINPVIDIIDATHAKGISYLQVVVPNVDNNGIPTILSEGTYQDEYRKVDGKWLIAKRTATSNRLLKYPGLGAKLGLGPAAPAAKSPGVDSDKKN